ncbi:hypothetical protein, partial [Mesomycoplasma ovipneumoniae]
MPSSRAPPCRARPAQCGGGGHPLPAPIAWNASAADSRKTGQRVVLPTNSRSTCPLAHTDRPGPSIGASPVRPDT